MFRNLKLVFSALFLVALTVQFTLAAATITVEQSGVINGNGMDGTSGIELIINYDTSLLSSPTVTKGGLVAKGMLAANTVTPGVIRIAIISTTPFSGDGQIAAINFASNAGKGGIRPKSASILDTKGGMYTGVLTPATGTATAFTFPSTTADSTTTGLISEPGVPFSQTAPSVQTQNPAPTQNPGSSTKGYTNTVTIQTDTLQTIPESSTTNAAKSKDQENTLLLRTQPETVPHPQSAVSTDKSVEKTKDVPRQQVIFKSVAERFKAYIGDKSLPIMTALFSKEISQHIHQEPPTALSDGKSRIKIIVEISTGSATSPNFALDNATILSVKKESGKNRRWIIEALPEVNTCKATLSIIAGEESFEYPLTVAPQLDNTLKTDQTAWTMFLKDVGTPQKPHYDLNNDGVRDYLDEFIFVANHLARK